MGCGSGLRSGLWPSVPDRHVGVSVEPGLEEPAMFKLPAYDPFVVAWLGLGVLAITALAFFT